MPDHDRVLADIDRAVAAALHGHGDVEWWREWLVDVPPYDREGVVVERFTVSEEQAFVDRFRAAMNPQRTDRSVAPGEFSRLTVDGVIWMTDTPAEISDLIDVDEKMFQVAESGDDGNVLIVGLGLGVVLHRAIAYHGLLNVDVVERDPRVLRAMAPHYSKIASDHGCDLTFHCADIHEWKVPRDAYWDVGFFDIWDGIDMDDRAEVNRLRNRFRKRLAWFGAWAQDERNAQAKRIREKRGLY